MADANPNRMDAPEVPEVTENDRDVVVQNRKTGTVAVHHNTPRGRPDEDAQVAASRKPGSRE